MFLDEICMFLLNYLMMIGIFETLNYKNINCRKVGHIHYKWITSHDIIMHSVDYSYDNSVD